MRVGCEQGQRVERVKLEIAEMLGCGRNVASTLEWANA